MSRFVRSACERFTPSFIVAAMKLNIAILFAIGVLAGCASRTTEQPADTGSARVERVETLPDATSTAHTVDEYKRDLAQRIAQVNSLQVYSGRPQALLRSVVVLRYTVDAQGHLVRSEIMRSNRDKETIATALASLRGAAPFPKPATHLLRRGQLEISETWLFNNDGRFQLRTIAQPQMDR
ncbi:MAG TPA: energy transducer TonB [Noviherbaspirillum sp.]|nr:energy transducer TonB [Noviherbaspirillum sp.]